MANIQDVRAINNPQFSYMWEVDIFGLSTGSLQNMSFFAKTVTIPQSAVEQIMINHKANKTHHAGRDSASHNVTLTFWDDEALTILNFFEGWKNLINNEVTGSGVSRDLYTATVEIRLRNKQDDATTATITLDRAFPIDVSDIQLSYDASEPVEISVTLSYDSKVVA